MMKQIRLSIFVLIAIGFSSPLLFACGADDNIFASTKKKDNKDKASKSIDAGDYDAAISDLNAYIAAHPEDQEAKSMLANAYMKKSGVDLITIQGKITSGSAAGSSDFATISAAMPAGTAENVQALSSAVDALTSIPPAERSAEQSYQLALAQASLGVTMSKQLGMDESTGKFPPEKVGTISDTDAAKIVTLMSGTSQSMKDAGSGDGAGAQKLDTISSKIQEQTGANDAEKLRNYLISQNG